MKSLICCILFLILQFFSLTPSQAADTCADNIPDCASYGVSVCTSYADWSQLNCEFFCGLCTGPPPVKECKDIVDNCDTFVSSMCTDSQYQVWAQDHCPKFCGFCSTSTSNTTVTATTSNPPVSAVAATTTTASPPATTGTPVCADAINFCALYSPSACQDTVWANSYCASFCQLC